MTKTPSPTLSFLERTIGTFRDSTQSMVLDSIVGRWPFRLELSLYLRKSLGVMILGSSFVSEDDFFRDSIENCFLLHWNGLYRSVLARKLLCSIELLLQILYYSTVIVLRLIFRCLPIILLQFKNLKNRRGDQNMIENIRDSISHTVIMNVYLYSTLHVQALSQLVKEQ